MPDTPENAAERAMLEEAITAAEDVLDGDLKAEIVKVTGTNEDEPKTAEDVGQDVAEKVLAAFDSGVYDSINNVSGRVRLTTYSSPSPLDASDTQSAVTRMTSSSGQTFKEIFNSDVTDYALGAEGALVPTISIVGEDVDYGISPPPGTGFPQGKTVLGWVGSTNQDNAIEGSFHCVGAGCEIKKNDNEVKELVGPWVFAPYPGFEAIHYVVMENEEGYIDVPFVEYGHWLTKNDDSSVNIHANARLDDLLIGEHNASDSNWGTIEGEDASATYSGNAAGRSVRHEFATDGEVAATHSGSFTADVDLTATFGDSPMLEGRVSGFSAVDNAKAVNTGWEVTLEETAINEGGLNGGVANEDGEWSAYSYTDKPNDTDARPDGIYGTFDADFTDGQAAGGFATRKNN